MALVLCTGIDPTLLATRRMILEAAGHSVVSVTNETALLAACKKHAFDVAVLGQAVSGKMKRYICGLIREQFPSIKVLELYQPYVGREVEDADDWLLTPIDVPKELADRVDELAQRGKRDKRNGTSA
jgi:CheY-like chemotaxis protein